MERKLASVQKILSLTPIEGADAIETAQVLGWSVVVKKGEFKVGDLCVYFEIDSLLPFNEWSAFLFKNGREGTFRLKTIRLRGQVSQGLALPIKILFDQNVTIPQDWSEGGDVSTLLGIVKYEPQVPACLQGICKSTFPSWIPKTDEERIQTSPAVLDEMKGKRVVLREKIDGASMTVYIRDGEFGVCSRNMDLIEDDNNSYWKMAKALDLKAKMTNAADEIQTSFAIQGELYGMGIQGNKYKLDEIRFAVFNVFNISTGEYLDDPEIDTFCQSLGLTQCPLVNYADLEGDVKDWVARVSGLKSKINPDVQAEGIVVRGVKEEQVPRYGRFSFKVINPEFLLKHGE